MSKHTRPPWHVDGMLVKDSLNRVVAIVRLGHHEAVIAESPRMLDALETMVAVFGLPEEWSHPDMEGRRSGRPRRYRCGPKGESP